MKALRVACLRGLSIGSGLDADAFSEDTVCSNPPVDTAAVVADLKPLATDRLDEVKIFSTSHLAEHYISDSECGTIHRCDGA
jgi:hypothetical protein